MLRKSLIFAFFAAAASVGVAEDAPRITEVTIEPHEVTLTNADQSVQFLVTLKMSDGTLRDGTRQVEYKTQLTEGSGSGDGVAAVERGRLVPKGDGAISVEASVVDPVTKQTVVASARATVRNFAVERELHFVNDIEPILTKTGCNTGGCHGKASGQNGFKLSLFAFEPKFDYDALVNEAHGRRVFPASPE